MRDFIKKYAGSYTDRVMSLTVVSAVVNLVSATANLLIGIDLASFLYIVNAAYYYCLVAARIGSVYTYHKAKKDKENRNKIESLFYRRSGLLIFLLAAVYFNLCVYMLTCGCDAPEKVYETMIVLFSVAYKLTFSAYGLYITRKLYDKITETVKTISFTDACISLITATSTLLSYFDENTAAETAAALGVIISSSFMITGTVMTVSRTKKYRKER